MLLKDQSIHDALETFQQVQKLNIHIPCIGISDFMEHEFRNASRGKSAEINPRFASFWSWATFLGSLESSQ